MVVLVYFLCALTSVTCAVLLTRGYLESRHKLLLWSSLGFVGLALNNLLLVADLVIFPQYDLALWRLLPAVAGMSLLVFGLLWDSE